MDRARFFPAIDITKNGTRKEELLVPKDGLDRIFVPAPCSGIRCPRWKTWSCCWTVS